MDLLGFPRGPVQQVVLADSGGIGPYGRKDPDCALIIYVDQMRALLADPRGPDTSFRTWVHESIHARQPYGENYSAEYARFSGLEEGLAEGVARLIVREKAGMNPVETSYQYFVAAYRTLTEVFGIDAERLWRRLWIQPAGAVRGVLVDAVDAERREQSGPG